MTEALHARNRYTIWSMVDDGGPGESIEDGVYEPPSN